MTERRMQVRVLLYGCSHKPRFSAMGPPVKGDVLFCGGCRRERLVVGLQSGWAKATVRCVRCPWKFTSDNSTKKKLFSLAQKHANAMDHKVIVENDGHQTDVKPTVGFQAPLIDDLLLP